MKRRLGIDYEQLFRVIPDNFLVLANDPPRYTIIDASESYLSTTMSTREQIIDKAMWDVYVDTETGSNRRGKETLNRSFREAVASGRPNYPGIIEFSLPNTEGVLEKHFWETTNYPVRNPVTGVVSGIILATHNVTDRVNGDRHLELLRKQQDTNLALGIIGFWHMLPGEEGIVVDEAMKQMFGITSRGAGNMLNVNDFVASIHPDDRKGVNEGFNEIMPRGDVFAVEYRIVLPTGQTRWIGSRSQRLSLEDGTERYVGIVIDITERKLAEEAFRERQTRLRFMADSMPQLVWTSLPDGTIDYINAQWMHYTGMTQAEMTAHSLRSYVHVDDKDEMIKNWTHSRETGTPYEGEFRLRGKRGEYQWFMSRAVPYIDDDGSIIKWYGTLTNIDERKRESDKLEELVKERTSELIRANIVLEQSNRELQDFAYVASHDLQEPLRKIQAFGNLLKEEHANELGDGRDYLERMQKSADRMSVLIQDLLVFSRVTTKAKKPVPVDMNEILAYVSSDLEAQLERTGGKIVCDSTLPIILADPTHIRQLLQNLIGNALKFHKPDVAPLVTILSDTCKNGDYRISITDNGIGFNQKYEDRIFSVFQRLHGRSEYEGTGIGLAICKKIVERYGGTITVKSEPGEGTTFTIQFPREMKEGEV